MHAKTLEKIFLLRSKKDLSFVKKIIDRKIFYQFYIIKHKELYNKYSNALESVSSLNDLSLLEARAAKEYWKFFSLRLNNKASWNGRKQHSEDIVNKLLDIGYHYLTQRMIKLFKEIGLPTEIGLMHKAQSNNSHPLVYDFMEWLRPVVVDYEIIVYFNKRKRFAENINKKDIKIILSRIKNRFNRKYYNKDLKYCVTLEYWTKLILLKLLSSINHSMEFKSSFPTLRHESRCKQKTTPKV